MLLIGAAAFATLLAFAALASAQGNKCLAGKNKCASKKAQGILKCWISAEKDGVAVDQSCVDKARGKFDGSNLVPPEPAAGCFRKLEGKDAASADPVDTCVTTGDTTAIEQKVDAFVDDVLSALDPTYPGPPAAASKCDAGKKKCVLKKMAGILKCHEKAAKEGTALDPACITKARGKFDGNALVPADPTKGCFRKLELKDAASSDPLDTCSTSGNTTSMEQTVDDFITDLLCELGDTTASCAACGNSVVEAGEDCDPPGTQCPNAATGILCSATCQCACPSTMEFTGTSTGGVLDIGWSGIAHDATVVSDGTISVDVSGCANPDRPCGVCTFTGPIPNADAADYAAGTGTQMNNHRCTGNTRVTCNADADCASAGGSCAFYFATLLPLTAGGVSTCVENRFNGTLTGTTNFETGVSTSNSQLIARVFGGATNPSPCPQCVGDGTANDGIRGGTCDVGLDGGAACDVNGSSPTELFGDTSLDCRPSTGVLASLQIAIGTTTGTATKTLSAASPNCRAVGYTGFKCMCDTCNNLAATPCSTSADCTAVGATICGGGRCQSGPHQGDPCTVLGSAPSCGACVAGANVGGPCATDSACPGSTCTGGFCGVPGVATAVNACGGGAGDCAPGGTPGPNDGECQSGPVESFCVPNATMIGCITDSECQDAGVRSCTGGTRAGHVCYLRCVGGTRNGQTCLLNADCTGGGSCTGAPVAPKDCPGGGSCDFETCAGMKTRECFLDNGQIGGTDAGSGVAAVPVNDASDPTIAALFCIGPVSSTTINTVQGLPGLGRLELMQHARGLP